MLSILADEKNYASVQVDSINAVQMPYTMRKTYFTTVSR